MSAGYAKPGRVTVADQILRPMTVLVVVAAGLTAILSALAAGRDRELERARHLQGIVDTLSVAAFPTTDRVLKQLKGITTAELIAVAPDGRRLGATITPTADEWQSVQSRSPVLRRIERLSSLPLVTSHGQRYYAVAVPLDETDVSRRLFVLYRQGDWSRDWWSAVAPPLAAGALAILVAVIVGTQLARRLTRRLEAVRSQVRQLAARDYAVQPLEPPPDEIHDLQASMNALAVRLQGLEEEVARTERLRVLAQLAAGLSHQQRNAITGARLSIQLHQRECSRPDDDLAVALQQLELTERSIRNILTLGTQGQLVSAAGELRDVLQSACRLVSPFCRHHGVRLISDDQAWPTSCRVEETNGLQATFVNLLVNAAEAAGNGGTVRLTVAVEGEVATIEVRDSGPGLAAELESRVGEPFATSKPYGIGLGLAYARDVVTSLGGALTWDRSENETCFRVTLPVAKAAAERTSSLPGNGNPQ